MTYSYSYRHATLEGTMRAELKCGSDHALSLLAKAEQANQAFNRYTRVWPPLI